MNTGSGTFLSSANGYTVFQCGKHTKVPYLLVRFTEIKEWDNGYLVVMAQYTHSMEPVEEYIDLEPILRNLYFDADEFLQSKKSKT